MERRPTAVLFVAPSPMGAGVVQEALPDPPPDRLRTVKAEGIGHLNLDDPAAPLAVNPQHVAGHPD